MKGRLRTATIWLGVLLSIVFAGLAFYGIDWRKTGLALRAVQWPYLGVAFVLMWAGFAWRTVRWKRLLDVGRPPNDAIHFGDCFSVMTVGYMANNILPARIGEVARAYLVGRKTRTTKSFALGTIVTERLADVLMLLLLISFTLLTLKLPPESKIIATSVAWLGFGCAAGLVAAIVLRPTVVRLVERSLTGIGFSRYAARLADIADRFLRGVSCGGSLRTLAWVWVDSFGIWLASLYMTWFVALACNVHVNVTQALYVMCYVNLGAMLPSAPGYVGTYQWFCTHSLGAFGVEKETALAFSFVSHVVWYVPLTLLGLLLFLRERLSWGQLTESEVVGAETLDESLPA
ncbi:MAG: flippase-like domain-containing protein [Chloracidobacterium sp.]|nr:flippase-like domain-containing protein [Chloracidobacterium sp.]MDW8218510.1 lysylphosphatidylglycerol synthase transmembrane domain-containing protein [Acidobacteriota bacterium]